MAHQIETFTDGTGSFVSARQSAWHQLGVVLDHSFTAEEAMKVGRLGGWNVRKLPLTTSEITEGGVTTIGVPNHYATVRDHPETGELHSLGVVGNYYEPVQNEEMAAFLNALVDEGGAHFETAGSLFDGRRCFLSLRLPEDMLVGGVDALQMYICATNSHDGNAALEAMVTPVRVVCNNTLTFGFSRAVQTWKIRHTSGAGNAVSQARQALDLTFRYVKAFEREAEKMIQTEMSYDEFRIAAKRVVRPDTATLSDRQVRADEKVLGQMGALFLNAATQENIRGTRWAGFQAVTEYQEHFAPVHAKGRSKDVARAERAASGGLAANQGAAFRAFAVAG